MSKNKGYDVISRLKLLYWNISGINYNVVDDDQLSKLDDDVVISVLSTHDIFCLSETHCSEN